MQIIVVSGKYGTSKVLSKRLLVTGVVLFALVLAMPLAWLMKPDASELSYRSDRPFSDQELMTLIDTWQHGFMLVYDELQAANEVSHSKFSAMSLRLANLQAQLERVDAAAEQLLRNIGVDDQEFNFGVLAALGGPLEDTDLDWQAPSFVAVMDEMEHRIGDRLTQLAILQDLLQIREFDQSTFVAGKPVPTAFISSRFGRRTDPFSGRVANHFGVDFAATIGTPIYAVASGIVITASDQGDFGLMVEINHGNGVITRYAHSSELMVAEGDLVRSGDLIALVGSTGRSTGPHLHFEVTVNGRRVDPMPFIQRQVAGK